MRKMLRIVMHVVVCLVVVNVIMIFLSQNANGAPPVPVENVWNKSGLEDFGDCKTCEILNSLNPTWVYANDEEHIMLCFEGKDHAVSNQKCIVFPHKIHLNLPPE